MRLAGANLDHTKRYNRRVVLEIARLHGPLSRADLTRATGLSPQTISNITDELCTAGSLRAVPRRSGKRGDPTVDFEINPEGGYTFGLSFDDNRLIVLLADIAGSVLHREELRVERTTPAAVLAQLERAVKRILARLGIARNRVWGAGLVIPGLIQGGELVALGPSTLKSWVGYPLADELQKRLGMPARIENDATAAAIGERLYGAARTLTDFVYLHVGAGVGAGLFIRGQPYRGGFGKSGEIGHMSVEARGRPCACGNRGCLERYASLSAAQAALTGKPEGAVAVDPSRLSAALRDGDRALIAWVAEAANRMRQAVVAIENLLDPQTIIVGGPARPLVEAIVERMAPLPRSVSSDRPHPIDRVVLAAMVDTPALGAATLPIFDSITPEFSLLLREDTRPLAAD